MSMKIKVLPHLKDLEEPIIREIAKEGNLTEAQLRKQLSEEEDDIFIKNNWRLICVIF